MKKYEEEKLNKHGKGCNCQDGYECDCDDDCDCGCDDDCDCGCQDGYECTCDDCCCEDYDLEYYITGDEERDAQIEQMFVDMLDDPEGLAGLNAEEYLFEFDEHSPFEGVRDKVMFFIDMTKRDIAKCKILEGASAKEAYDAAIKWEKRAKAAIAKNEEVYQKVLQVEKMFEKDEK